MTFNGQSAMEISADVFFNGTNLQYGALVVGYADVTNNLFVKVQNNTSSTGYDIVYFYYGNNGNSFGTEPTTFALTPFTSARMSLTLVGTVATFMLDTNFDGIADQTFTRTDVPIGSLGTGIGLGFFGATTLDNFSVVPEPSTVWLMLLGAGVVAFSYRAHVRRRPIAGPTI